MLRGSDATPVNVVDEPASTEHIYSTLLQLYGSSPEAVEFTPDRRRYQLVDNERLRTSFGCPPETSLEAGLQSIVNWHKAHAEGFLSSATFTDRSTESMTTGLLSSHDTVFIDGEWLPAATRDRIEVVSPWSEEVIASVPSGSREDIDRAVGGGATSL